MAFKNMKIILIILLAVLAGCGTMEKAVEQADGSIRWVPIMRCRSFARDLSYRRTVVSNGVLIVQESFESKSTTASVVGSGAKLLGAASDLMP